MKNGHTKGANSKEQMVKQIIEGKESLKIGLIPQNYLGFIK
ncbi:hypothetical protein [Psittacicella melopsittaci]|nr:hypothetical protein [Psittacicella melopsittaci]